MKESDFRASMLLECLGEPIRFQIVRHLQHGPKTVSALARFTKRHQATISQHLAILRNMQVVRYRNRGRFAFYELKLKQVVRLLDTAVDLNLETREM